MESPIKRYKEMQNINGISRLAYDELFTKYIIKNEKGERKLTEIGSTDQESVIKKFNGGLPLPGFIYTFIYPPTKENEVVVQVGDKEKRYADYVPLMFCIGINKNLIKGINLNALPNIERVKFLEIYHRMYRDFFKDIEKKTENNKIAFNKKFISLVSRDIQKILKDFSAIASANFNYGFRSYDITKIKQLRMIEYSEWEYIPFYNPKEAFKLMNQKNIHDLYWKTK